MSEDYAKNIEVYTKKKLKKSISLNLLTRNRGYVSTVRKQDKNALDCIKSIFTPNPIE